jgi:hypothetical protein
VATAQAIPASETKRPTVTAISISSPSDQGSSVHCGVAQGKGWRFQTVPF